MDHVPNEENVFAIAEIVLPVTNLGLKPRPGDIYLIFASGEKVSGFLKTENGRWVGEGPVTKDSVVTCFSTSGSVTVRWLFIISRNQIESAALSYGGEENIPLKPYIRQSDKILLMKPHIIESRELSS